MGFFVKNIFLFVMKFCNNDFFCNVYLFSILNILQVSSYRPSIFNEDILKSIIIIYVHTYFELVKRYLSGLTVVI